jgi:hypothetical protein
LLLRSRNPKSWDVNHWFQYAYISHRELLVHTPPQLQRELQATTLRRKIVPTYEIGKMGREMRET